MTLGYLEAITTNSLEIVKFKIKKQDSKQILLISNYDCLTILKKNVPNKKLNDFITNSSNINQTGRIIIENNDFFTIQKGRPYFFPNCKNEDLILKTNLQYKFVSPTRIKSDFTTKRKISLNYYDILSVKRKTSFNELYNSKIHIKREFQKLFLKNNGKFYSCLIPQFFKKFSVNNKQSELKFNKFFSSKKSSVKKMEPTLLLQSSEMVTNKFKDLNEINYQLTLVKFVETEQQRHSKAAKSVGLYSITEDFFEQDVNSVFCRNTEFIETGKTIYWGYCARFTKN
jgi:hypothetical protein